MINEKYKKIIEAAQAGGQVLKKYFGQTLVIEEKGTACDVRTKADTESEAVILEILKKYFPEYNIFSEEIGKIDNKSEFTFVIDPLDGSNNFVTGIPNFSVSIALLKNHEIEFGVVYNPILDNIYYAEKNKGAFLNEKLISINPETDIHRISLSHVASYGKPAQAYGEMMKILELAELKRVFYNWSVALDFCYLASGKIEAILNDGCEMYDYLAGKPIAKEAGAVVVNFDGTTETSDENNRFIIANTRVVVDELLKIIK